MANDGMTRHGTNAHPELPPCPLCGEWAWKSGGVFMGGFCQCGYKCNTAGCVGAAEVLFLASGFACIYRRPSPEADRWRVPEAVVAWLNDALKLLGRANCQECVYGDKPVPDAIVMTVPAPGPDGDAVLTLVQDPVNRYGWCGVPVGAFTDLAPSFRAHVADCIAGAKRRGEYK